METRIVPNKLEALSLSLSHTHTLSGVTSRSESYGRDRRVTSRDPGRDRDRDRDNRIIGSCTEFVQRSV